MSRRGPQIGLEPTARVPWSFLQPVIAHRFTQRQSGVYDGVSKGLHIDHGLSGRCLMHHAWPHSAVVYCHCCLHSISQSNNACRAGHRCASFTLHSLAPASRPSARHAAAHIHGTSALIRFLSGSHATPVLPSIPRISCCWRGDSPALRTQYLGCWGAGASCSTTWAAYLHVHTYNTLLRTTAADPSPRTLRHDDPGAMRRIF